VPNVIRKMLTSPYMVFILLSLTPVSMVVFGLAGTTLFSFLVIYYVFLILLYASPILDEDESIN